MATMTDSVQQWIRKQRREIGLWMVLERAVRKGQHAIGQLRDRKLESHEAWTRDQYERVLPV